MGDRHFLLAAQIRTTERAAVQGVRALSPLATSLLLVPGYTLSGVLSPWSGRLADRFGARVPASLGLALQTERTSNSIEEFLLCRNRISRSMQANNMAHS